MMKMEQVMKLASLEGTVHDMVFREETVAPYLDMLPTVAALYKEEKAANGEVMAAKYVFCAQFFIKANTLFSLARKVLPPALKEAIMDDAEQDLISLFALDRNLLTSRLGNFIGAIEQDAKDKQKHMVDGLMEKILGVPKH